jgi:hypothetical protein
LYFSEVLQGYFKLWPRRPIERLRIEYAGKVYYWVERAAYSRFSPTALVAAFIARRAAKRLAEQRLVTFRTDGICLGEGLISQSLFNEVTFSGRSRRQSQLKTTTNCSPSD